MPCHRPSFPTEIWSEIFSYLGSFDIYCVSRTDHFFYDACIGCLLYNQTWNADRRTVLDECSNPYADPKRSRAVHVLTLRSQKTNNLPSLRRRFDHFTSLHTLCFYKFSFADDPTVYTVIHQFLHLIHLSFNTCSMPPCCQNDLATFETLPIQELDLVAIYWPQPTSDAPLPAFLRLGALNLLTAPHLQILRIDWTVSVYDHVLNLGMLVRPVTLSGVHTLELTGFPDLESYSVSQELEHATSRFFLHLTSLRHLRVMPFTTIPSFSLSPPPLSLHTYHGGIRTLNSLGTSSSLVQVELYNVNVPSELARHMPRFLPALRSMRIILQHWDIEIMHCAVQTFPYVEDLRINYVDASHPNIEFFDTFAFRFLPLLPNLRVFHLYCGVIEGAYLLDRFDGFVYMKRAPRLNNLLEVRFQLGASWKRETIDSNEWNIRVGWPSVD